MVARCLTLCLALVAGRAVAQDIPETAWLQAIPEEADAAIRVRAVGLVQADLVKMITAMSPALGDHAGPVFDAFSGQFAAKFGQVAVENPMMILVRVAAPGADGGRPYAVILKSDDYLGVKKSIAGGNEVKAVAQAGGYEKFAGPDGKPIYSVAGPGYVGFGEDETLVSGIAKPAGKPRWTEVLSDSFLRGDVGLFVNVAALQKRHGGELEAAKARVIAGMDQAGNPGGEQVKDTMKGFVSAGFDAVKVADSLAFHLDFEPYGLVVAGSATVLPGTPAAAKLAAARPAESTLLETLPADGTFFTDIAANPETVAGLQKLGLSMLGGKADNEAMTKAMAMFREAGITEMATASFGTSGNLSLMLAADPAKAAAAAVASIKAVGEAKGDASLIKSVTVRPEPRAYKGFTLTEAEIVVDLEKLARLQPNNPQAAEAARKMFGGDTIHSFIGTDGRRVLTITSPTWEAAQPQVDVIASGVGGLGKLANYATLREQIPHKTNFLMMGNAQSFVRQVAAQMAATLPNGEGVKPGEMPAQIAVFGAAVVAHPEGYQFLFRLPSAAGPVFEKGFTPLIQAMQGKVGM